MVNAQIIGSVFDTTDLVENFKTFDDDVELTINSPGGGVMAGLQLCRAIQDHGHTVTAKVKVMAASIAGVIALACDRVEIDKNSLLMFHNCWTFAEGNKEDLENKVEAMKAIDAILHNYIKEHCNKAEEIEERLNKGDVWLTGEEAAEMFENVELVEAPAKEGVQNDCASLVDLLRGYRAHLENKNKPAPEPPYVLSSEMEALLAEYADD